MSLTIEAYVSDYNAFANTVRAEGETREIATQFHEFTIGAVHHRRDRTKRRSAEGEI